MSEKNPAPIARLGNTQQLRERAKQDLEATKVLVHRMLADGMTHVIEAVVAPVGVVVLAPTDLLTVDVRSMSEVRMPTWYPGQLHRPELVYSDVCGGHVMAESLLEGSWVRALDFDQRTTWILGQPFRVWWTKGKGLSYHVPDLLVERGSEITVMNLRPESRVRDRLLDQCARLRTLLSPLGWEIELQHELPQAFRTNLQFLAAHVHMPWGADVLAAAVMDAVGSGTTVGRVASVVPDPRALPTLFHLVRTHHLMIPTLRDEFISHGTEVVPNG